MSCHIWNKESNLLFDYETKDYSVSNATISSSGQIIKSEKKALFTKKIDPSNPIAVAVIQANGDEFSYKFEEDYTNTKSMDEKAWIVIKNMYNKDREGYKLREGDVIKLGKVMFKIRELKSDEKSNDMKRKTQKTNAFDNIPGDGHIAINTQPIKKIEKQPKKKTALPACRICLMDDNDTDNPLINPCNCIGSVRFIHLQCIKQWLRSKIVTKTFNFLMVHSFKGFECEICKAAIPEHMKYKNEMITLTDFAKPESNYIMLESISREKRDNKYLYIIHMKDKNTIRLGRANDADVRMTDISVSRNHAMLKLRNGKFFLDDNNSKFGTHSQIQNDILFYPNRPISIQCGKLHLFFELIKTCYAWIRCYTNKLFSGMDYNDQLENQSLLYHQFDLDNLISLNTEYTMSLDSCSIMKKHNSKKVAQDSEHEECVYQVFQDKESGHQLSLDNSERQADEQHKDGEIVIGSNFHANRIKQMVTNNDMTSNRFLNEPQVNFTNNLLYSQLNINSTSAINLLTHHNREESKIIGEPHRHSHCGNNQTATNLSYESPVVRRSSGIDLLNKNNVLTIQVQQNQNYHSNKDEKKSGIIPTDTKDSRNFIPVIPKPPTKIRKNIIDSKESHAENYQMLPGEKSDSLRGNTQDNLLMPIQNEMNSLAADNDIVTYIPVLKDDTQSLKIPFALKHLNTALISNNNMEDIDQMIITPTKLQPKGRMYIENDSRSMVNLAHHFKEGTCFQTALPSSEIHKYEISPSSSSQDPSSRDNCTLDNILESHIRQEPPCEKKSYPQQTQPQPQSHFQTQLPSKSHFEIQPHENLWQSQSDFQSPKYQRDSQFNYENHFETQPPLESHFEMQAREGEENQPQSRSKSQLQSPKYQRHSPFKSHIHFEIPLPHTHYQYLHPEKIFETMKCVKNVSPASPPAHKKSKSAQFASCTYGSKMEELSALKNVLCDDGTLALFSESSQMQEISNKKEESESCPKNHRIIMSKNEEELQNKQNRTTIEKNPNDKKRIAIEDDFSSESQSMHIYSLPQSPSGHRLQYQILIQDRQNNKTQSQ